MWRVCDKGPLELCRAGHPPLCGAYELLEIHYFVWRKYFQGGQINVSKNRGGHTLELKDINCENWLNFWGPIILWEEKCPPQTP